MAMDCHLVVPELFLPASTGAAPYQELVLPALETLLARGLSQSGAGISLERWLAAAFRVTAQYDLPLAPASLRGEGVDPGDACWLHADPVHLKVQGDRLILADASCFEITASEAADLLATLNAHFLEDGIEFIAPVPQRWYARVPGSARIRTTPSGEVTGRSIEPFLPSGDDAARWRRFASEAQMLLHQHPCNDARDARGDLPVNSLWFWGAGRGCAIGADVPYGAVWSAHPLARGLAANAGLKAGTLPGSGADLIEAGSHPPYNGAVLVVVDELRRAACDGLPAWRNALAALETRWFAPLVEALQRGALRSVALHALGPDTSVTSVSTRLDGFKFWRRKRRLADYVRGLHDRTGSVDHFQEA